ncbi:MAG: DedA family protein [Clostridium perfringens]|nr:DedA family protein [Clostridium perfringens]
MLETLALPIPGELLMAYCGFLVYSGRLSFSLSILVATLGVIVGLTIAYLIGDTVGMKFLDKYGKYFGVKEKKIEKVSNWFDRYGSKLLLISCFIPGIRHITGYFAGIVKIPYKKFALNGYIGAFIWVTTFIYLGSIFGENFKKIEVYMSKYILIIVIILIIISGLIYIVKSHK